MENSYYTGKDGKQALYAIENWDLGFSLGNVFKYMVRAGKKDPEKEIEDLEKAIDYLVTYKEARKEILKDSNLF